MVLKRFCGVCGKEMDTFEKYSELILNQTDGEATDYVDGIDGHPDCIERVKDLIMDVLSKNRIE